MVEVRWSKQAIDDINNIAEFIARDSTRFAKIQVQRFFELEKILQNQPLIGRKVPEFSNKYIKEIILGNYRVIYKIVSDKQIDVLTVHHSKKILRRKKSF